MKINIFVLLAILAGKTFRNRCSDNEVATAIHFLAGSPPELPLTCADLRQARKRILAKNRRLADVVVPEEACDVRMGFWYCAQAERFGDAIAFAEPGALDLSHNRTLIVSRSVNG